MSNTKKESEEIMKNLVIVILLVVLGVQCAGYSAAKNDLQKVQEDYINLQICIEEGIL